MKFSAATIVSSLALLSASVEAGICSDSNFDSAKLLNKRFDVTTSANLAASDPVVSGSITVTGPCAFRIDTLSIGNLGAGKTMYVSLIVSRTI